MTLVLVRVQQVPSTPVPVRGQPMVGEFFSPDKWQRVMILQHDRGVFRVRGIRRRIENWEAAGRAFWIQVDAMNAMTDRLDDPHRLIGESLAGIK